jgi:micrococcal nuclease
MEKDTVFRFRLPDDLLESLKNRTDNISGYIRQLIETDINQNPEAVRNILRTPYFYYGRFVEALDGDTVRLQLDVGFEITLNITARLHGVNSPEINTAKGKVAQKFTEKQLKNTYIVVETKKREKYSRYLAKIYYHKTYSDFHQILQYGKLLNQELIDAELAVRYDM